MKKPTTKYALLRELLQKEIAKVISEGGGLSLQAAADQLKVKNEPVPGEYRVSHTYEQRGDLKHSTMIVKASSEEQAKQKAINYMQSISRIKGNSISGRSIKITGVEPAMVVKEASTDQPGPAAPPVPPVAKAQPKPVAPIKQPDPKAKPKTAPQEPKENDKTGVQVVALTNNLIQKIKHTVGVPESDDIAEALTSLIQAWGFNSEQKLTILKSVRNNSVH